MMDLQSIIWLASFPKSGNTWLRSFLNSYLQPKGEKIDINELNKYTTGDSSQQFFDLAVGKPFRAETVKDWLAVRPRALRLIATSKSGHHFVKTHCKARTFRGQALIPPALTSAAIYIIRNPFDIAPSYARHNSEDLDAAITRMTDPANVAATDTRILEIIGRWDNHVRGWATASGLTRHIMRYEDMVADPEKSFRAVLDFVHLPVNYGQMRRALRRTSFSALQKQEAKEGFRERPGAMERFFARGAAGGWREELTPEQVARIRAEFLPTLEKWYPEMLDETRDFAGGS